MKFVLFCHSLDSDWNHGNAHFLRGVVSELLERDHQVDVYEPVDGWSRCNLVVDQGAEAIDDFRRTFPQLRSTKYHPADLDVGRVTQDADVVIVHEWTDPDVVAACGRHRKAGGYRLLFHDTHHRMVTEPEAMAAFDLAEYNGVLAFGDVISQLYIERDLTARAWTWHEAADTCVFGPMTGVGRRGDLVWVGNWGDGERAQELQTFLMTPVQRLGLQAQVYGVRYPQQARAALAEAGIRYGGWRANYRVPAAFAAHAVTVHVPRRPYVAALPGVPTIRMFEALACGIPLVSAPWDDVEHLFRPGTDYLVARSSREMERHLDDVLHDKALADSLRVHGLETIRLRHTCAHRVDELLKICADLGAPAPDPAAT
ncbi:MAG: a-glycosyltransferase, Glycosyltransferase Family 4-like protein [Ilumatobacteraceae bacterium]|nr:a-glycosyltransferase, Glycosyltransferase Family 4-like protein [Ilumatobacteraceae bacterium]